MLGVLSSHSPLSMLVGAIFKNSSRFEHASYSFDFCTKMDLNGQLYGLAAFHGRIPHIR
jgi:hypothetical protein